MLKDIYSPLEIDEQWDQRAPMVEGDSSMDAMSNLAPEAGGAAAVAEPPVPVAPAPADPIVTPDTPSDIGHFGGGMMNEAGETPGTSPDTGSADTDDHAAELLSSGSDDTEMPAAIADPAPEEAMANKAITDPVVSFTPEHPRPQPAPGEITSETTIGEDAAAQEDTTTEDVDLDIPKIGNKPDDIDTESSDTSIVMADDHDSEHKPDATEEVTTEETSAPEISEEEHDAAGERLDAMSDVLKEVDEEVESILAKLSAEDSRLEELLTEKNTTITNTQAEVADIEAKRKTIADKQATLAQMEKAS